MKPRQRHTLCVPLLALCAASGHTKTEAQMAPELAPNLGWINTDRPLRLRDELKGHVVLLDFWTYCCINCMHILPDLEYLEEKYADEPFIVIGVHSAKFQNESERQSIRNAVFRYDINHPVVIDDDFAIWRRFGASGWPTFVVIGADGRAVGSTSGEGNRGVLDRAIGEALEAGRERGMLAKEKVRFDLDAETPSTSGLFFPGKVLASPPSGEHPGYLFIADSSNHRVVVATFPDERGRSELVKVVGAGAPGYLDGEAGAALFNDPQGMAFDAAAGTLYVADRKSHAVRAVDLDDWSVRTVAGNGVQSYDRAGGESGLAQGLSSPWDLELAPGGETLYVAMAGPHQLWTIDLKTRVAKRLAGSGIENILDGPAEGAQLAQPSGLSLSSDGSTLYFADSEVSAIRALDLRAMRVRTLIGAGLFDFGDIDGAYPAARFQHPLGVTVMPTPEGDRLLVADTYNHKIKLLRPKERDAARWLGVGRGAKDGVGGSADALRLDEPGGLDHAALPDGSARVFVADTNNHRVVMIDPADASWREVVVNGLRSADRGDAHKVDIARASQADVRAQVGAALTLRLAPSLGTQEKLNPEAPVSVRVSALGADSMRAVAQRTMRTAILPVSITLPDEVVAAGARLLVEMSYAVCDDDASVCLPRDASWVVTISEGAGDDATLTTPKPLGLTPSKATGKK